MTLPYIAGEFGAIALIFGYILFSAWHDARG